MKKIITIALLLLFILSSCTSETEVTNPNPITISYTNSVKTIIDGNCLACHIDPPVNNAPMHLTTYQSIKESVENRNLIGRIEDGTMPPGNNNLTPAQIKTIKDWQSEGFKE